MSSKIIQPQTHCSHSIIIQLLSAVLCELKLLLRGFQSGFGIEISPFRSSEMPVTRGGLPRHELDGLGESGVSNLTNQVASENQESQSRICRLTVFVSAPVGREATVTAQPVPDRRCGRQRRQETCPERRRHLGSVDSGGARWCRET
jgi:hypothetical protein